MTAISAGTPRTLVWAPSFYTFMAMACAATAFIGYIPTYWSPMAAGQFQANPVVHVHGAAFFTWTLFTIIQTGLVPARQVALHRTMGFIGVSLATALTMLGLLAALNSMTKGVAAGQAYGAESFLIVPLQVIVSFAVIFILAVANIRNTEVHKRLMLLATIAVLNAPIARPLIVYIFKYPPTEQLPVSINVPATLVSLLLVVPALIYDWKKRGRPHPVYLIALPAMAFVAWVVIPISETAAWHAFAKDFVALAGHPPIPPG
jgi:hypothetical protein